MRWFPRCLSEGRLFISMAALVFAAACTDTAGAPTGVATAPRLSASASSADLNIDPALLTPNPVENSAEGTVWDCRKTGDEVQCTGHFTENLGGQENGVVCNSTPVIIVEGTFTRDQVRYFDSNRLEYRRQGHLDQFESWSLSPDGTGPRVEITSHHLQSIVFEIPGDLDSRRPTETGLNVLVRTSDGRVLAMDAGRSTATGPLEPELQPDTFRGRWDFVTLGEDALIPIFCAALMGQ